MIYTFARLTWRYGKPERAVATEGEQTTEPEEQENGQRQKEFNRIVVFDEGPSPTDRKPRKQSQHWQEGYEIMLSEIEADADGAKRAEQQRDKQETVLIRQTLFPGHKQSAKPRDVPQQDVRASDCLKGCADDIVANALRQRRRIFASVSDGPKCELREYTSGPKQQAGEEIG